MWKPAISIFGSILFGFLYVIPTYIPNITVSTKKLFEMLPYVVTIIVLVITSIRNKKENQPPASLGLHYFREER
ncbi:MAG: ABC transporter permease, partial [Clostridia bacterium]|nr:ABC transporter permease [Clostridia bacterium]